jgi:hypothetical protein
LAWGSCYSPDFRVASVIGAAAGTTAANDRRLIEATVGSVVVTGPGNIDVGRYDLSMSYSSEAENFSIAKMAATPRYIGAMCRFRISGLGHTVPLFRIGASTAAQSVQLRVVATTGVLSYSFNDGSTWTDSSATIAAATNYRFEVFVDFGTSTTHTLKVRVDAVEVINATGGSATSTALDPQFGSPAIVTGMTETAKYADIVTYNDVAQYASLDDWRVFGLQPTVDGTHVMTANDFQDDASVNYTSASTGSWSKVDDAPSAAPTTTDFVKQVVTRATSYMEWQLKTLPAGCGDPVLVCLAAAMHPVAAATANSVAFRLVSGANASAEAAIDTSIASNTLEYRKHHYPTEPGGAAWTNAMIQTPLRARFGYSGDAAPPPALDAIMAFVVSPIPPFVRANTFEGVADGTTISIANSVNGGDAFDNVNISASTTVKYSTTTPSTGSNAARITIDATGGRGAYQEWDTPAGTTSQHWQRFNLYLDGYPPSATVQLLKLSTSSAGSAVGSIRLATDGTLRAYNAAGTGLGTASSALPIGQWIRVEVRVIPNAANGEIEVREWNDGASAGTADYTSNNTGAVLADALGSVTLGQYDVASGIWSFRVDDWAMSLTTWLGPTMTPAATVIPDVVVARTRP